MKIFTHPGTFHADEVLAIALLSHVSGKSIAELNIKRTRDTNILNDAKADPDVWVLDIGGVCEPSMRNLDHHQRGFDRCNDSGSQMSTFGLIVDMLQDKFPADVYDELQKFSIIVDDQDNGVNPSPYLRWIADFNGLGSGSDSAFYAALMAAKHWLTAKINAWAERAAQDIIIAEALKEAGDSPIIVSHKPIPIDERLNSVSTAKVVVVGQGNGVWHIQSLNTGIERDSSVRCPAPKEWRGRYRFKVDDMFVLFTHAAGFLTVAKNKSDAMRLAEMIVAYNQEKING